MWSRLKRLFHTGPPERQDVARAVAVHDAILEAGVFVHDLAVAVSGTTCVMTGKVANEESRARALAVAQAAGGDLVIENALETGMVTYWLGQFEFEAMPPAGAKQLRAWDAVSQSFSDLLVEHEEIVWFLDAVATRCGVRPLRSFGFVNDEHPAGVWHAAADAVPTLVAMLAADKATLVAAGVVQQMPDLDAEQWKLVWQGLTFVREALEVAASHGIKFEYH